jgi:nicotinamide mononucleotide transporter
VIVALPPLQAAIGWFTSHDTNTTLPWMDSTLTSFSLVGQFWTAHQHSADWLLDILYVGTFVYKGLWPTAGFYLAITELAVRGYAVWP